MRGLWSRVPVPAALAGVLAMAGPGAWAGAMALAAAATPASALGQPAAAQDTRVLLVVGLGGDDAYRRTFQGWAMTLRTAALERLGVAPGAFVYLGERPADAPEVISAQSTKANVAAALARMAREAGPRDRILVVLVGHGSGQGEDAQLNLPGPDLTPPELDVMLRDFPTQTVAVVNTASSSGPFASGLSGPNRIVVTATRTAQERNETQFGGFFVEALAGEGADLDKDGRVSLLEAFEYARQEVLRYYGERNLLATEHAQLEDDGDGKGTAEPGEGTPDGLVARTFFLGSVRGAAVLPDSVADPVLRALYQERIELERRIQELRALRGRMEEARYEAELEELLVALALKSREIREKGGGGG